MDDTSKFNQRNPAVKRIMQEIREIQRENGREMMAQALEDNLFEWHFAVRGPPDSDFEVGFLGQPLTDYPFKPPAFMLLTPNGRFETGVKICLSISAHHPEHWQPSWSVRTALTALIAFMPTPASGALGSLDFPKEERRRLAQKSRTDPPKFGGPARQKVVEEVHEQMLSLEASSSSSQQATRHLKEATSADGHLKANPPQEEQRKSNEAEEMQQSSSSHTPSQPLRHAEEEPRAQWVQESSWEDKGLGILAAAISIAIMAILGRKALYIAGIDIYDFF